MENNLKVIGFGRVSSKGQLKKDDSGASIETQETLYNEWCEKHNALSLGFFKAEGESASKADIPPKTLAEIIKFCKTSKVKPQKLIIHKLDRFSRQITNYHYIKRQLTKLNVQIEYIAENISDTTATDRLIENVQVSVAQYYAELNGERAKLGLLAKSQRGYFCFVPPAGYKRVQRVCIPDEATYSFIRKAWEMLIYENFKPKEIVDFLKIHNIRNAKGGKILKSTLSKIFHNPFYYGAVKCGDNIINEQGIHKPMITKEEFEQAQLILKAHAKGRNTRYSTFNPDFILNKTLKCKCGYYMTGSWAKGRGRYGYYYCHNAKCKNRVTIRNEKIEGAYIGILHNFNLTPKLKEVFSKMLIGEYQKQKDYSFGILTNKEKQAIELQKRLNNLEDLLIDGYITKEKYLEKLGATKDNLISLNEDINHLKNLQLSSKLIVEKGLGALVDFDKTYKSLSIQQKAKINKVFFPDGLSVEFCNMDSFKTVPQATVWETYYNILQKNPTETTKNLVLTFVDLLERLNSTLQTFSLK